MAGTRWRNDNYITTWRQFWNISKPAGCSLLSRLDEFPNSILVTGCQRSGTTLLSRIINDSDEITKYWFGPDDELDAALILSGYVEHEPQGRYCFQTTYVNECFREYFKYNGRHKIIWVLRNPSSVIYSMLYNWIDDSLNELYRSCGGNIVSGRDKWLSGLFGEAGIPRLRKACWAYKGKTAQIFELYNVLSERSLLIIDYDDMVKNKERVLRKIYRFVNLYYRPSYADNIHSKSLKKTRYLSQRELEVVKTMCESDYLNARALLS